MTLALLPGSRIGEIEKHLPVMLETVDAIAPAGQTEVVIPAANDRALVAINRILARRATRGAKREARTVVQSGGARDLLRRADCAVVASGTATLEAALANCPTVLVYKASPLFAFIARRVIRGIRFIGLANIIWDKSRSVRGETPPVSEVPMPELLQENFTVENLTRELRPLLTDAAVRAKARERLAGAMSLLNGEGDAIGRIAEIVAC